MGPIKSFTDGLGGRLAIVLCAAFLAGGCITQSLGARPSPPISTPGNQSPQSSPASAATPLSLASIQRVDARVGFIAAWTGGGPGLAKTTDGGATWQKIKVPTARITALRFINADVGWAAGFIPRDVPQVACEQAAPSGSSSCYGVVLRTVDGGATWQKTLLIADDGVNGDSVRQIQAIGGDRAWALTFACTPSSAAVSATNCPTKVQRPIDGGRTWTVLISGYITAFRFATAMRGWLAIENPDGSFNVRVTSDGGNTRATVLRTTSGDVVGLDAADSQTAWVMTQAGGYCTSSTCTKYQLLGTTDGGSTWSNLGNPKPSLGNCFGGHLIGPLFASATRGWLAENLGAGGAAALTGLLQTEDGGRSWDCSAVPTNTYLVSAADPGHIWVTTNHGGDEASALYSSEDGGLTWHAIDLGALG